MQTLHRIQSTNNKTNRRDSSGIPPPAGTDWSLLIQSKGKMENTQILNFQVDIVGLHSDPDEGDACGRTTIDINLMGKESIFFTFPEADAY